MRNEQEDYKKGFIFACILLALALSIIVVDVYEKKESCQKLCSCLHHTQVYKYSTLGGCQCKIENTVSLIEDLNFSVKIPLKPI